MHAQNQTKPTKKGWGKRSVRELEVKVKNKIIKILSLVKKKTSQPENNRYIFTSFSIELLDLQ